MQRATSAQEFADLKKAAASCLGLIVHFSAAWCEPCKSVNELLEKEAAKFQGRVIFVEVDCDACPYVVEAEGIDSVPVISFYRDTASVECVATVVGAKLDLIARNTVSLYGEKGGLGCQRADHAALDDYLTYLIKRPGIVLFITGTPSQPRCGFTGKLCEMVEAMGAPYVYYDVMASDEVCEGLKRFSNWPTYPQVYVDGELIGGLDVCKQLQEEGELRETLKLKD